MSRRRARAPVPRGVPLQLVWNATRDDNGHQEHQEHQEH
jgi:hypothetical protein